MIKIGMIIGDRYEILEKIGTGGMSDVYKAKDHKLNRFVALKVLKQEFSENANFVSKFRIEAQAAGLACLFSDAVTDEVVLSQGARRLSLKAPDSEWATEIDALARAGRRRSDGVQIARDAGYDIVTEAERLTKLYLAMSERQR